MSRPGGGAGPSSRRLALALTSVLLASGCTGDANRVSRVATLDTARAGHIHERLEEHAAEGFSGAVVVAEGGEPVLEAGYGLANRDREIPFRTETVSDIGSITKVFTATAVLNLVARGGQRHLLRDLDLVSGGAGLLLPDDERRRVREQRDRRVDRPRRPRAGRVTRS